MADDLRIQRERWLLGLFEAAGYEVTEEATAEGSVDRFATQRRSLAPPRIWWVMTDAFPDDVGEALERLRVGRLQRGADRALWVVWEGAEPRGYRVDLRGDAEAVVTRRHLAMDILGAIEAATTHADRFERRRRHENFLPRRVVNGAGEEMDAVDAILAWARGGGTSIILTGGSFEERRDVVDYALWRAVREASKPEEIPLIPEGQPLRVSWPPTWAAFTSTGVRVATPEPRVLRYERAATEEATAALSLLPPRDAELRAYVLSRLASDEGRSSFRDAFSRFEEFREVIREPVALSTIVVVANSIAPDTSSVEQWTARVCAGLFSKQRDLWLSRSSASVRQSSSLDQLERSAFELLSLGESPTLAGAPSYLLFGRDFPSGWLQPAEGATSLDRAPPVAPTIRNPLIRDWLAARWIVRCHAEGRTQITVGHVFPERWVLLFIAVMAPEVSAHLAADRVSELHQQIERQVERRVQLALAHQLNRIAGAITAHLETVEEHLRASPTPLTPAVESALQRLHQEVGFQRRLASRSSALHADRGEELQDLLLLPAIEAVRAALQRAHDPIELTLDVENNLAVRAFDEALREMLHCVAENAMHAAACCGEGPCRVDIIGRREGDTVVVLIRDNGPGVRDEDRERIFEPLVTTKKGRGGQPMGTGLGLPIARRYASLCGARVTLLDGKPTTFELRFVAGATP